MTSAFTGGLDPIESASRDEVENLQTNRLQWTVRHAYENVAHYRATFDRAGVHPDDIRGFRDLARLPFTVKDDLRRAYPFGMFAVPRERVLRIHASSGTTGKPTVVGYTQADLDVWANLIARSLHAAGGRPGDILHNAYGYGLFTGGLGFHYGAERLGCTCIPLSGGMTERQVQLMVDFRPDILTITPSYALALADEFERQGVDARQTSLRVAICGAEPWTEAMRNEIEERFGIQAINHFGLSEIIGPGVAAECAQARDGLTFWEDHFYPEIIDPESGEILPDGAFGELVITTLTREALPMLRYRTRDLTRLLPPSTRPMRRIERIAGRSDDMLIIRGVNVFPSQVETVILDRPALSPHYYLELSRPDRLDQLAVVVEARPGLEPQGEARFEEEAHALTASIKSRVGVTAEVRVMPVGSVERSMGKAKRVVDRRPH